MNKITTFLVIIIATLSLTLIATMQSKAQNKAQNKNLSGVIPFMTSSDRLGFLDQKDGRVYFYDSNFSQCLFIGQVTELGKPIEPIK
jgi:hypothetical protein